MPKSIAFLKKGTFKDSSGKEHTFGDAELDTIVAKYDPSQHEAPEVIGHPKTDAPAWGWVKGVKREGDILFYEPGQRVAEFQDMVSKGMFKKRSAAFYPDLTLKHVGWLGAQPPAVKGLPDPVTFAEGDAIIIEFSEEKKETKVGGFLKTLKNLLRSMSPAEFSEDLSFDQIREKIYDALNPPMGSDIWVRDVYPDKCIISDNGDLFEMPYMVAADGSVALGERKKVELIYQPVEEKAAAAPGAVFSESKKEEEMETVEELKKQLKERDDKIATFAESEKAKDARLKTLVVEARRKDFAEFCEGLKKEGKLPPAVMPQVMDFMEILSGVDTFEFAEGDGKKSAAPGDKFKELLGGLGKVIEFSEVGTKDKATKGKEGDAGEKLDAFAKEKMKANKDLSYTAAFAEAQTENAELASEYAAEIRG